MKVPDSAVFAALVADAVKAALAQAVPSVPSGAPVAPAPVGAPTPPVKMAKETKARRIVTIRMILPAYASTHTDTKGVVTTRTHTVALADMEGSFAKHNPFVLDGTGRMGAVGQRYALPDFFNGGDATTKEWYAETVSLKVLARHAALYALVSKATGGK